VEGKTLSKDEGKKELSLEKLEEVEKAYLDLMKAYSSCLSNLHLKKRYIIARALKRIYSFSWDKVPGEDSERLLRSLKEVLNIGWAENAEIRKSDDNKTICIFKDENSAEITIDETKGKATLKISDDTTLSLNIKKKRGKLNINPEIKQGGWVDLQDEFVIKHSLFSIGNPKKWYNKPYGYPIFLTYRFVRWKIRSKVDLLREAFLLLMAQNRNKVDSEVIKKFEKYCEDMDKLRAQFAKNGLITLFYAIIPVVLMLIGMAPESLEGLLKSISDPMGIYYLIGYAGYLLIFLFVPSFLFGKHIFSQENVSEKERKIFLLIQEYLKFV
jgi:hypothetical protein